MNVFRLSADAIHLLGLFILLGKLWWYKSSAGVSAKAQILYTLVFSTRYLDLFTTSPSTYNTPYKVLFLCLSYVILTSIYIKFYKTYDKDSDTFRIEFLIFVALVLAFVFNYSMEPLEILWTFSEYLESVAMWPQFYMIMKTKKVSIGVFLYLLAMGIYRILYVQNWIFKFYNYGYYDQISEISGSLQIVPYVAFWMLCLSGVVKITREKTSWFVQNLTENDQNSIFTIKLPSHDSKDCTPLLVNAVDVVKDDAVIAKV